MKDEIERLLSTLYHHTIETHSVYYTAYERKAIHDAIDSIHEIINSKRTDGGSYEHYTRVAN